jgi:hypothetical protein
MVIVNVARETPRQQFDFVEDTVRQRYKVPDLAPRIFQKLLTYRRGCLGVQCTLAHMSMNESRTPPRQWVAGQFDNPSAWPDGRRATVRNLISVLTRYRLNRKIPKKSQRRFRRLVCQRAARASLLFV